MDICIILLPSLLHCAHTIIVHTQEVTSKCVLRVNEAYSNKRTKFKITTAAQKETIQVCVMVMM